MKSKYTYVQLNRCLFLKIIIETETTHFIDLLDSSRRLFCMNDHITYLKVYTRLSFQKPVLDQIRLFVVSFFTKHTEVKGLQK